MARSWIRALAAATFVATAVTAAFALFLPIFSDEIGWKMLQSRLLVDGGVNIRQLPASCGAPYASAPPFFLYPFRWLDAIAYGDLSWPLGLRIGGIVTHLGWLLFTGWGLARALGPGVDRWRLAGAWAAAFGLGTLPFILVLNRPEQMLLWGAAALALAPFLARRAGAAAGLRPWAVALALLVVAAGLFGEHPKGLFFLPVALVAIAATIRRPAPRWSALAVMVLLAAASTRYWQQRFACDGDPILAARIRSEMSLDRVVRGEWLDVARAAVVAQADAERSYGAQLAFGGDSFRWLQPEAPLRRFERWANRVVRWVSGGILLALLATAAAAAGRALVVRRLEARDAASLALAVTAGGLFLLQARRLHYEAGCLFALALLSIALGAWLPRGRWSRSLAGGLLGGLMLLSIASQAVLWHRFAPRVAVNRATLGAMPGQAMSISAFRQDELAARVLGAARSCGIDPSERLDGLVLDDLTYPALGRAARLPLHMLYVTGYWAPSLPRLDRLLRQRGSAGIVVDCRFLRGSNDSAVREVGGICCLPAFRDDAAAAESRSPP